MSKVPLKLSAVIKQLPPMPQVLGKAMQVMHDPNSRRSELAGVLSLDQGLTGRVLQMVNSAYYGLPRRITSLDEAIGFLGYETVEEMVFAISASETLSRPVPSYMLERRMLWRHSVAVADGCDWIAQQRGIGSRSDLYVAGLLHDVGKLVMDLIMQGEPDWEAGGEDGSDSTAEEQEWTEMERHLTGMDHAEIGAIVVRSWNLPDRVIEAVAYHHTPGKAELDPKFTAVLHIANVAAMMSGIALGIDGLRYNLEEVAIEHLAWTEEDMLDLMDEMQMAVKKAEQSLGIV